MKMIIAVLMLSSMVSPVFAEAPGKPAPLFPDAPPPPQIAPSDVAACCTNTGRFSWINPLQDQRPIEGDACETKTSDGQTQTGTVCY